MQSLLKRLLMLTALTFLGLTLSGCEFVVLNPAGDIAQQERDLIIIATLLMLLVVIPVIILTLFFAWQYRIQNKSADYKPEWHQSKKLEWIIWGAPLVIIMILGSITWKSTHELDPYQPLQRVTAETPVDKEQPGLTVEVVALNWKWLFIYPELGIATVNELAAPIDTPIHFKITADSIMNAFYVPALAGQIYAMPGMQTQLNAVINDPGEYQGFSSHYSGAGFSQMRFKFYGMQANDFDQWLDKVRASKEDLTNARYQQLTTPSQGEPVHYFSQSDARLFNAIVNECSKKMEQCPEPGHSKHHHASSYLNPAIRLTSKHAS